MDLQALGSGILETLIYSVLGIIILIGAYKILSWVVPFDLNKELSEDDNPAVGIFVAGMFIALGLIIAASIGSPSSTAKKAQSTVKKSAIEQKAPVKLANKLPVKSLKSGR